MNMYLFYTIISQRPPVHFLSKRMVYLRMVGSRGLLYIMYKQFSVGLLQCSAQRHFIEEETEVQREEPRPKVMLITKQS